MNTSPRFHWWTSMVLLVVCGLMAAVFRGRQESLTVRQRRPEDRNILRIAYTNQSLLPDPQQRRFPLPQYNELILSLWEPLVECDPATGLPQPAAARSWEWSPDKLNLTLELRPDARWSNGDPLTAGDFVRSWLRLLHEDGAAAEILFSLKNAEAYHRGMLKEASAVGVRATGDHTLRLELEQVRSTLVAELADPLLSPLHHTSEKILATQAYASEPAALVTNGPFHLVQASQDGFRLEKCEYYHGHIGVRLAGVQFVRVDSLSMAQLLVAAGVVDLLSPTSYQPPREPPTNRRVNLETELEPVVHSLDFNVTRGPLHDLRVRRALALAQDRVGPIRKYAGRMVPAWSWVPSMPGREGLVLLKEDVTEARRLLTAAGYPGGKEFPVLTMALPQSMQANPYPAVWSERWFQELGVRTHLIYEPPTQRAQRLKAGDYDVLYSALIATVPDAGDLLGTFLMPPEDNNMKWTDKDVVRLLNEANTKTGKERLVVLEQAERAAMAAVPTVPMMFERRQSMLAVEVRGWYEDPLARQSPKRLWLDPAQSSSSALEPGI